MALIRNVSDAVLTVPGHSGVIYPGDTIDVPGEEVGLYCSSGQWSMVEQLDQEHKRAAKSARSYTEPPEVADPPANAPDTLEG